jgi:hypothetical protein
MIARPIVMLLTSANTWCVANVGQHFHVAAAKDKQAANGRQASKGRQAAKEGQAAKSVSKEVSHVRP